MLQNRDDRYTECARSLSTLANAAEITDLIAKMQNTSSVFTCSGHSGFLYIQSE